MIGRKLGVVLILLGLGMVSGRPAIGATVSSYDLTPKSGGPGTVVHITGQELYTSEPLVVHLVIALETSGPGGMVTKFQPITKLGLTRPDPVDGHPTATVVIPGQ